MKYSQYMGINLRAWVYGTIQKVQEGDNWNSAWEETYRNLGGKSANSGRKVCPMVSTKALYLLGRIKNSDMPYQKLPLRNVWNDYSKNGTYSILALEGLSQNPDISLTDLWRYVQHQIRKELRRKPGAVKSRWHYCRIQALAPWND